MVMKLFEVLKQTAWIALAALVIGQMQTFILLHYEAKLTELRLQQRMVELEETRFHLQHPPAKKEHTT